MTSAASGTDMESIVEELRRDREAGARRLEGDYRAGLMTLARRLCADEGDAEELVNRTFAAVVEGIDNYVEQSAFFGWMCQILANIHSMDVRRKSNRVEVADADAVAAAADDGADARVFRDVDASLLRDAVETLPANMREAILLHYFLDMPVAKIARFLSIPNGTVLSRLHYARLALAAKLGTQRPGVKMLLLALLLAAGLAIGGGIYAVATAAVESHAESAELVFHAESAETAEPEGGSGEAEPPPVVRAENAETTNAAEGGLERARSALPTPAEPASNAAEGGLEPSTPDTTEMNAKSLLAASASLALAAAPAAAQSSLPLSGGRVSYVGNAAAVHTFTNDATLVVAEDTTVRALFVAGGGGGGNNASGGGGGGGVVEIDTLELPAGTYTVVVGAGGAGGGRRGDGANGGNTTLLDAGGTAVSALLPALGGGGGRAWENKAGGGLSGGCGGGNSGGYAPGAGTEGQGYAGGQSGPRCSSGGGGAGGPGGDGDTTNAVVMSAKPFTAHGGPGRASDITGSVVRYGGGGGAGGGDFGGDWGGRGTDGGGDGTGWGGRKSVLLPGNGTDGLGGGGGGAGSEHDLNLLPAAAGRGGCGAVILRYAFDLDALPAPSFTVGGAVAGVLGATIRFDLASFGADGAPLSVSVTATPVSGGTAVVRNFSVESVGESELVVKGLAADTVYAFSVSAGGASADAGRATPVARVAVASGGSREYQARTGDVHKFVHEFTESGTLVVTLGGFADILLVGGGGGGGHTAAGGGGGGGVVYLENVAVPAGSYAVTVGAGGAAAPDNTKAGGSNGGSSSFFGFTAYGGGGGGSWVTDSTRGGGYGGAQGATGGGSCGGSGSVGAGLGVCGGRGLDGQGYRGGASGRRSSGGGGGAGGPGGDGGLEGNGVAKAATNVGGAGRECSITGVAVRYGGGGGGGGGDSGASPAGTGTDGGGDGASYNGSVRGGDGADGLGGGGGGGGVGNTAKYGGNGGSGIVVVAFRTPPGGTVIVVR